MSDDQKPESSPQAPSGPEPARARALFSTADFKLLRTALTAYARQTEDREELAKINALHHRLGTYC